MTLDPSQGYTTTLTSAQQNVNFTLQGAQAYTGSTTIDVGFLALDSGASVAGPIQINTGTTPNGDTYGGTLVVSGSAGAVTVASDVSGGGGIYINGEQATFIGSLSAYTGRIQVDGSASTPGAFIVGTANFGNNSINVVVSANATFDLNGHAVTVQGIGDGTNFGQNPTNAGTVLLNGGTLTLGVDGAPGFNNPNYFAGTIQDGTTAGGGLVKTGDNTLQLVAANSYSGGTTIERGIVQIGDQAALGTGPVTLAGGTFQATAGVSFEVANNFVVGPTGGTIDGNGASLFLNGNIADGATPGGPLTFTNTAGSSTTILNGSNTYTGGTIVTNQASLQLQSAGALPAYALDVQTGGLLDTAGHDIGATVLTGGGVIFNSGIYGHGGVNANTFTVDSGEFSGNIGEGTSSGGPNGATSGTLELLKETSGTLVLRTSNGYSGGTLLDAGQISVVSGSLGSGTVQMADATTIAFIQDVTGLANDFVLNGTSVPATFDTGTNVAFLSGTISGNGGLTKTGSSSLLLTGADTYTGGTTISEGILQIGGGGPAGSIVGNVSDSGELIFARNDSVTFGGVVSGSGSLGMAVAGTLTLTGANTYAGGTYLNAGVIQITNSTLANGSTVSSSIGTGPLYLFGGTIQALADLTLANPIALRLGGGTIDNNGHVLTLTGDITDGTTPGVLTFASTGGMMTVLSGHNTFSSGAIVSGNVALASGNALGAGALQVNGTADLAGFDQTVTALTGTGTISNSGRFGGAPGTTSNNTLTVQSGSFAGTLTDASVTVGNTVFSGTIGLTKVSDGTAAGGNLVLAGANLYSGATTILGGTLQAGSDTGFSRASAFTVGASATLDLAGYASEVGSLAGAGTVVDSGTAATLTTGGLSTSTTFSGVLADGAGALGLRKTGSGALTLTGPNSYSGGTALDAGTVKVGNGQALGSGPLELADATRLSLLASFTLGNAVTLTGTTGATIDTGANDDVLSGAISGGGALLKVGTGTLTLTGGSSFTGGTVLDSGTIAVGTGQSLGSGPVSLAVGTTLAFISAGTRTVLPNAVVSNGTAVGPSIEADAGVIAVLQGVVSGAGGVAKTGAGQVILAANETYTGGTTIGAGVLQVGNGGPTGSILGDVLDDANLAFSRADRLTFAGVISGMGSLTQFGPGTLALTGANTYAGGTNLAGGILQVDNSTLRGGSIVSSSVGTGTLAFLGNGALQAGADLTLANALTVGAGGGTIDNNGHALTLSGTITDGAPPGKLTLVGSLTTVFTGTNTYTGGTALDAGTLAIGNGQALGSGGLSMADGTTLAFLESFTLGNTVTFVGVADPTIDTGPNTDVMSGVISGPGSLTKAGTGSLTLTGVNTYSGGTVITAGTLIGSSTSFGSGGIADNAALVLDQPAAATFANAISGSGTLTKAGDGTLELTGASSLSGATTVAAGALVVDGSLANSSVTVASGATLGGFGTLGSFNALQGGTVAPGVTTPFSTLKVGAVIAFQSGSTYRVAIDASGRSDSIQATGAATLNGGTVNVLVGGSGYSATSTYTLLAAAGGVSGRFGALTTSSNLAFLRPALSYGADAVTLGFGSNGVPFAAVAGTPNQRSVAAAAQSLGAASPVFNGLQGLTATQARTALDSLSGAPHSSAVTAATQDVSRVTGLLFDRLWTIGGGGIDARTLLQQLAPRDGPTLPINCFLPMPAPAPPPTTYTVWGEGFGDFGHDSGNQNGTGLDRSTGGFVLGIDTPIHGFTAPYRVGFAGGYSNDSLNARGSTAAGTYQSVFGSVYGGARYGSIDVRAGASVAGSSTELNRAVAFPGFAETEHSVYGGNTETVFGEVGYRFAGPRWVVEPVAGASYIHVHQDSYRERGGAAALAGAANENDVGTTTLGAHAEYAPFAGVPLVGKAFLGWRHALGDVSPTTRLAFEAGGPSFAEQGAPIDIDALAAEAGVDWVYSDKVTLGLSYVGQVGSRDQDHGGKGRFEVKF